MGDDRAISEVAKTTRGRGIFEDVDEPREKALAVVEETRVEAVPVKGKKRRVIGLRAGFGYPLRGARLVFAERADLVRFWVWPIALTALSQIAVVTAAFTYNESIVAFVWPAGSTGVLLALRWVLGILVGLVLMALGLVVVYSTTSIVASPFNDALSQRVELYRLGLEPLPFSLARSLRGIGESLFLAVLRVVLYGLVLVALFLASWILPTVGQVVAGVVGWFVSMLYLSYDSTDWPLARRDLGLLERLVFIATNLRACLGMGAALWLVMSIPIVNLFFMPAAAAAGTLLVMDIEEAHGGCL